MKSGKDSLDRTVRTESFPQKTEMRRKIKKWIKNILIRAKGKEISKLSDAVIDRAEIISFDVFDTLVVRNVKEPADVFDLVENAYNRENPGKQIIGFKRIRIESERRARSNSKYKEITLDEIYDELESIYGDSCKRLRELEISMEKNICQANEEMKCFYDKMRELGKRIIIISDMYLSKEIIKDILDRCGYEGYEKIFVSSEYRLMKRDGSLFEIVKQEYVVGENRCTLHIGDHPLADDIAPKKKGLQTFLYCRDRRKV